MHNVIEKLIVTAIIKGKPAYLGNDGHSGGYPYWSPHLSYACHYDTLEAADRDVQAISVDDSITDLRVVKLIVDFTPVKLYDLSESVKDKLDQLEAIISDLKDKLFQSKDKQELTQLVEDIRKVSIERDKVLEQFSQTLV